MLKIILQFNLASVRGTTLQWNWIRANGEGGGGGTVGNRAGRMGLGSRNWSWGMGIRLRVGMGLRSWGWGWGVGSRNGVE